ncbi:membrane protein [Streptomyces badius]
MFILGLAFGGLWWASIHYGRKIDEAKARWAAQQEAEEATA